MDVAAAERRIELIHEQMVETGVLNQMERWDVQGEYVCSLLLAKKDVKKLIDIEVEGEGTKQG